MIKRNHRSYIKKNVKIIIIVISSILGIVLCFGGIFLIYLTVPNTWTELDTFLERKMDSGHIPGLSYGIMKGGKLVREGYLGYAELETNTPVTEDTLFDVASTSKLITTTAIMILVDEGKLDLDEDLDSIFPFLLRNPNFPSVPITVRMLLAHTSSITDNSETYDSTYTTNEHGVGTGGDSPMEFEYFINETFDSKEQFYNPDNTFADFQPGTEKRYSNTGMGLVGYLVEVLTGKPFNEFCREKIFNPLEMDTTGWFISEIDERNLAYKYERYNREYLKFPHYGFANYPDGGIKTRVQDWANFFQMYMNGGIRGTKRILTESTVEKILSIQFPEIDEAQALGWVYDDIAAYILFPNIPGHSGGDFGIRSQVAYDPETNNGIILFVNYCPDSYIDYMKLNFDITRRLLVEADIEI